MRLGYGFEKDKLPRGMSFPLKRSLLDAALSEGGVARILFVHYRRYREADWIIRAEFLSEAHRGFAGAGMSSIVVSAVPSAERVVAEAALSSHGLPLMVRWLHELEESGNARRGMNQQFVGIWRDGKITVEAS